MTAKYIFRLDDITQNMDCENFKRVKSIFIKNDIQPIIGLIPNNKDPEFLAYPECDFNIWEEVKYLQEVKGWSVAMHGYNHFYESNDGGLLELGNSSEFAGLPRERQDEKITKGVKIFTEKEIEIDAFMAPSHSFDSTTIDVLISNGINTITDGYSLYPYYDQDMLFVPQLFEAPRKMPFGIYTWCLHTNNMSEKDIDYLEKFIIDNKENVIPFTGVEKYAKNYIGLELQNFLLRKTIIFLRKIRNLK